GVLVLSEFAGAAAEMGEALLINPYDEERTATTIKRALLKLQLRWKIVEDRPEGLIGVTLVEPSRHVLGKIHGEAMVRLCPLRKYLVAFVAVFFSATSGPSDPVSAGLSQQWIHRAC